MDRASDNTKERVTLLDESYDDKDNMQRRVKVWIMNSFFTEDEILQTIAEYYDHKFGFIVEHKIHIFKGNNPSDEYVQISWKNIDL